MTWPAGQCLWTSFKPWLYLAALLKGLGRESPLKPNFAGLAKVRPREMPPGRVRPFMAHENS